MAPLVRFVGTRKPRTPGHDGQQVWSYVVKGDFAVDEAVALGLPLGISVAEPRSFPADTDLADHYRHDGRSSRHYVVVHATMPDTVTISFVAGMASSTAELLLFTMPPNGSWESASFVTPDHDTEAIGQLVPAPAATVGDGAVVVPRPAPSTDQGVFRGRPIAEFTGTLPYAAELFGVYQSLTSVPPAETPPVIRFAPPAPGAPQAAPPLFGPTPTTPPVFDPPVATPAPIGLVNLFREYFFEFDTFLGPPAGHIWISPGGAVEVVEVSTRRTREERSTEESEEIDRKTEESLTNQDDIADAVKSENSNDTKLSLSLNQKVDLTVYGADAHTSFDTTTSLKHSQEQTHKHTRTQSSKVASEIKRNYKTTFKTVTEVTDTTSRRYVVQNTTGELVNYELRRKMRQVGVQLQHVGTRMCWEVFLPAPGGPLGLGELVHSVQVPDLSSIPSPTPIPHPAAHSFVVQNVLPFERVQGDSVADMAHYQYHRSAEDENHGIHEGSKNDIIQFFFSYPIPTIPDGFKLEGISLDFLGKSFDYDPPSWTQGAVGDPNGQFAVHLINANFGGDAFGARFDATFTVAPKKEILDDIDKKNADAVADYQKKLDDAQVQFTAAIRERLKSVSTIRPRPTADLRSEERQVVYAALVEKYIPSAQRSYPGSEAFRQIFDVDEMLYFVAPNYWQTGPLPPAPAPTDHSYGRYPAPGSEVSLDRQTVATWYAHEDWTWATTPQGAHIQKQYRTNYLITEDTQPAPMGSSLGWLIQLDGDDRRNEFLNSAWVKAVLPIQPGRELDGLHWLARAPELRNTMTALSQPYNAQDDDPIEFREKTMLEVLEIVAGRLREANTDMHNTLRADKVFDSGFDPLKDGFQTGKPYEVFDQWTEVLPTDQIAAVSVEYDAKTGRQR